MYRAVMVGINRNNLPKDDPQRKAKHRRELLRQAAKRNNSRNKKTRTTTVSNDEIKKLRQRLSAYEKKLAVARSQNNKLNQKYRVLKQANYHLKKENKEIRLKNRQAKQDHELLKEKYQNQLDELNAEFFHEQELGKWFSQKDISDIENLKKYVDKITDRYELMSLLFQVQVANNKKLFSDLMDQMNDNEKLENRVAKQDRQITDFNREREKTNKKLSLQKKKKRELKELYDQRVYLQNTSPDRLINLLARRCSTKTFSYYDNLNILVRKYEKVLDELVHEQHQNDHRYGYIKFTQEGYLLHDVNSGEDIQVGVLPHLLENPNFTDGSTVRCRKNKNGWEVERFYFVSNKFAKPVVRKHKEKKTIEHVHNDREIVISNLDELTWAMQKKVLVVGNKFSSGFLDELKKYCKLQVMDAYEDGLQQIFNAMHTSDYVFILIGSVPHVVTEYTKNMTDLNENSQKVQTFETPAKYDGVIRLHYLFVNS